MTKRQVYLFVCVCVCVCVYVYKMLCTEVCRLKGCTFFMYTIVITTYNSPLPVNGFSLQAQSWTKQTVEESEIKQTVVLDMLMHVCVLQNLETQMPPKQVQCHRS